MRSFEFALKKDSDEKMYEMAQLPEYQTLHSAGADFFCAEEVVVPSMISLLKEGVEIKPTLVHTGIKACMKEDEVLELYNRSSNPNKRGLILANSVGVIDADYYNNPDNDGEIMFAFYNFSSEAVTIKVGERIGQGVFKKFLRPDKGLRVKNKVREGGHGSTNKEA